VQDRAVTVISELKQPASARTGAFKKYEDREGNDQKNKVRVSS